MTSVGSNNWSANIPEQTQGSLVYYYIRAVANNGKVQVRPITAPQGWWRFRVLNSPNVALSLKVFLEGAYDTGTGLMRDDLRVQGLIPLTEPYTAAGFTLVSNTTPSTTAPVLAIAGNNAIVDWVLVEARATLSPFGCLLYTSPSPRD